MSENKCVQPENHLKDAYTVDEVAKILDMKIRATYDFCNSTESFIVKRTGPRTLRIHKRSFDEWWNSQ